MEDEMAIVRPETPQPDTQSEDEIAVSAPTKKFTFHRPISQTGTEAVPDIVKKRKQTSPLKQSDRFIARTDPVRHMERGMQMLEEAKTHLAKNEASLLEQAISLVQHALAHTQPEPSLEEKFATFAASLNERLCRMETTLASGSPVSSQASLSESTNTDKTNRGNIRSNTSMSYATAASYRGSTTSSGNDFVTVPSNRTNDGFTTVQHASRNQPKAVSARSFTDQRVILIGSSNTEWQKDVKATRDRLNEALKVKLNTQKPVIASITKTAYSQNTVLVATQHFTAQDLMNNTDIIQPIFAYERIQKDVQWFKTMVHGVAISDFDTATGMAELRKDIEMFNPKLRLATLPRWVTPRENRIGKMHGSVVLSFDNEEMHQWSLRGKLFVGGVPCHTRDFKETKPTDWCMNCQHYGHTTLICHKQARCGFCAENHPTMQHYCGTCRARNGCEHVTCVNCTGSHAANDKKCNEWQVVLQKQHRNRTRTNQQDSPDPLN
jgi:hypothetical protein